MLDITLIRTQTAKVKANLKQRNDPDVLKRLDEVLKLDEKWRKEQYALQGLKSTRNKLQQEINTLKKAGKDIAKKLKELKDLPKKVEQAEESAQKLHEQIRQLLLRIPNILDDSVPVGKDASGNGEVRKWGKISKPKFPLKSHVEVAEQLGLADFERSAKVAGSGFYYLKGGLALLNQALLAFARDVMINHGFVYVEPPLMMRRAPYEGVTDLGAFGDTLYKIEGEDLHLIATSEHPLTALHTDEVFSEKDLPVKYTGYSMCFRKEVGSSGIDTKGLFRTHQFNKIEMYIFCHPDHSWKMHEELVACSEEILQKLGIPYRVLNLCSGDIGRVSAKTYDLEVWMPRGQEYRECGSCSNCLDYQARRLNIKFGHHGGAKEYVHTLNNTAMATSRILVALLENFQNQDSSVDVPKVLWPYMGGVKKLKA